MGMHSKPKILAQKLPKPRAAPKGKPAREKATTAKSTASSNMDSDIDALQHPRKGRQLLSSMGRATSVTRSMPTSPALSSIGGSPSLGPVLSGTEKALERKKEQRISIIHELAAQDQTL